MPRLPIEEHKKYYESIPHHQRSQHLINILQTSQLPGSPICHNLPYPHEESFNYHPYTLNYYACQPNTSPTAIAVFLHGLYSYGGNSGYLGVNLTKAIPGLNFYSLDFLNFGKSKGDCRGYISSFQFLVEQASAFVEFLLTKFQQKPKIFLVGESLGGAVAFKLGQTNPQKYNGVIFLNPALRQIKQSQYIMKKIGKLIGYLLPKIKLTPQSFTSTTKYDTQQLVLANPYLYNDRHIPGSIRAALNAMEQVQTLYKQFKTPYIVFQGGVDKSVDIFAPLDLEKQSPSPDKTTVYLKQMWHSVFFEEEVAQITETAINWIGKRM